MTLKIATEPVETRSSIPINHHQSDDGLDQLTDLLFSPNMLVLAGLLVLYGLLFVLQDHNSGEKLASGRFAGAKERKNARQQAIHQIEQRKHNAVAFYIGTPTNRDDQRPLYFPDAQRSTLVLGGPGSGKTYSLIDPALRSVLQQGFPIMLYDFKYPSQAQIAAYAMSLGYEVHIFAPGFPESGVINPLQFLRGPTDTETARSIISVMKKNFQVLTNSTSNRFFDNGGDLIGEGGLVLSMLTEFKDLPMAQTILSLPSLPERLAMADHINPWILKSFAQLISAQAALETVSGLIASATEVFSGFIKPNMLGAFCGQSTIPLDLEDRQLIIFGMDRQRRDVVGPVVAAIIHMLITRNVSRSRETPLMVFLDELPTLMLPALAQMVNENRSDGLCVVAGVQSYPQLEKTYGRELARVIFAGFGHKVVFNPQDSQSAQTFSQYLGEQEVVVKQHSRSYSRKGGTSRSVSEQRQKKPLVSASELLKLKTGECIIVSPGLANAKEAYVPLKTRINIPKRDRSQVAHSQTLWPKLQEQFRIRSPQRSLTEADILARIKAAEDLLPLPEDTEDNLQQQIESLL